MKINVCGCVLSNRPFGNKEIEEINIHRLEITISFSDNTFSVYSRNSLKELKK